PPSSNDLPLDDCGVTGPPLEPSGMAQARISSPIRAGAGRRIVAGPRDGATREGGAGWPWWRGNQGTGRAKAAAWDDVPPQPYYCREAPFMLSTNCWKRSRSV